MSFSSYYPSSSGGGGIERGNGEDSGAGSDEGFDPAKSSETPRSSGSKRSRAAEVHNLSEKRRRSRINEKMKALQNLIPNSNKTDKASMLDEAIEYLKQLQLQVQMLSMRNGLNVHPLYLPGAMPPLQDSQLMSFGENTSAMNMAIAGLLPFSQDSSTHNSFNLSSHCKSSHQPIILSNAVANSSAPETSFGMESSQSHLRSFQLQAPAEGIYTEDSLPHQQLDPGQTERDLSENKMKAVALSSSSQFVGQASSAAARNDHLEDHPVHNQILIQHLDRRQEQASRIVMPRPKYSSSDAP